MAEELRTAAGEGRIDLEELDERLEATYAARTYADLVPITIDLPSSTTPARVERSSSRPSGSRRGTRRLDRARTHDLSVQRKDGPGRGHTSPHRLH